MARIYNVLPHKLHGITHVLVKKTNHALIYTDHIIM
jgi:hypothetical protein